MRREPGEVRIFVPRSPFRPIVGVAGLLFVAVPLIVVPALVAFFRRSQTPDAVAWTFLAFVVGAFCILPLMALVNASVRSRHGGTIVTVSPRGSRIQERGAWTTRTVASLDAADLLDVDCSTRESTVASARRAAEERARESYPAATATIGGRTERILGALALLAQGGGVLLKTPQGLIAFGDSLADDEIRYLYAVVRQGLDRG